MQREHGQLALVRIDTGEMILPELPEVETVARGVARNVTGLRVDKVMLTFGHLLYGHPAPLCAALAGKRISEVLRRGKQVHIELEDGWQFIVHLGMTGRLVVVDRDLPLHKHTHMRMSFRRRRAELRFVDPRRFGRLWLTGPGLSENDGWIGRTPPPVAGDPLKVSCREFQSMLQRNRQVKAFLLDQQPLSGIGHIYCDESLHRSGIHPGTLASALDAEQSRALWRALRQVLKEAIKAGGSTISDYQNAEGKLGLFQSKHRVYGRAGEACKFCGETIERLVVAGRGTFICPQCQPVRKKQRR
jgi:formamidopyrimidine-DNA glycosylase